ncbi:MAG: hypothetical protein WCK82_15555, partial [Bacteroidota bacterium]
INQSFVVTRGGFAPPDGVALEELTLPELFRAASVLGRALASKARALYEVEPEDGPAAALRRARASARIDASDRLINGCDVLNAHAPSIRRGGWTCHDALSIVRGQPQGVESAAGDIAAYFFSFVPTPALVPYMGIESWDSAGQREILVYDRASMGPRFVPDYAQLQSAMLAYASNLHTRRVLRSKNGRTDFMVDDFVTSAPPQGASGIATAAGGSASAAGSSSVAAGESTASADAIFGELVKIQAEAGFAEARDKRLAGSTRGRRLGRIVDSVTGRVSLPAATLYRYITDLVIFTVLGRDAAMRVALMGKTCSVLAGKLNWLAASSALADGRLSKLWAASHAQQPSLFTGLMGGALEDADWWAQQLGSGMLEPLQLLPPPGRLNLVITSSDASDVAVCAVVWRGQHSRGGVAVYRRLEAGGVDASAGISAREMLGTEDGVLEALSDDDFVARELRGGERVHLVIALTDSQCNAHGLTRGFMRASGSGDSLARDSMRRTLAAAQLRGASVLGLAVPRECNRASDAGSYAGSYSDAATALREMGIRRVRDASGAKGLH